jgi:hypothetical protein
MWWTKWRASVPNVVDVLASIMWLTLEYGGAAAKEQLRELAKGVDVLVATPGRLTDFVDRGVAGWLLRTTTRPTFNRLLLPVLLLLILILLLSSSGSSSAHMYENKHRTDVESPPPPPHVCMSIHRKMSHTPILV